MGDELLPQNSEDQLAYDLECAQERLNPNWLEQLDPDALDGDLLAPMRAGGRIPAWLRRGDEDVTRLWAQLRGVSDRVAKAVCDMQERGDADDLLSLVPSNSNAVLGIPTGDWRYVGLTRDGDRLELWFSVEYVLQAAQGELPGAGELATLRVPLTSSLLRKYVFDRVEWRNRPAFVVK